MHRKVEVRRNDQKRCLIVKTAKTPPRDEILSAVVPHPVAETLREQAKRADRSISGQIRFVLRNWVAQQQHEQDAHEVRAV